MESPTGKHGSDSDSFTDCPACGRDGLRAQENRPVQFGDALKWSLGAFAAYIVIGLLLYYGPASFGGISTLAGLLIAVWGLIWLLWIVGAAMSAAGYRWFRCEVCGETKVRKVPDPQDG